ncbi:GDSL esterase/lipase At2g23540-like [Tripterygium wilfordii]|uniref:GDSL esterase/lipase At2g23540-like n=1 Tax=Tripterygium wilfordii TaxID=458696 RepID=UPI0018F7EF9E|nr:GDSL esterase/lipase At2g23540-like [Tripterygium wilfordii]
MQSLYNLGARKFGIISMPPLGCCPYVRDRNNGKCLELANEFAKSFFIQMKTLLELLSKQLPGMTYSLGNSYKMTVNIIQNPLIFGIKETRKACCGNGTFNGLTQCDQTTNLCAERQDHLFWDWFHPTQAVSRLAALTLYGGSRGLVTPMNFSRLVQI